MNCLAEGIHLDFTCACMEEGAAVIVATAFFCYWTAKSLGDLVNAWLISLLSLVSSCCVDLSTIASCDRHVM